MLYHGLIMSGCDPETPDPEIMGKCDNCGEELREDYDYYTDKNENKFCCCECAMAYYKIECREW